MLVFRALTQIGKFPGDHPSKVGDRVQGRAQGIVVQWGQLETPLNQRPEPMAHRETIIAELEAGMPTAVRYDWVVGRGGCWG